MSRSATHARAVARECTGIALGASAGLVALAMLAFAMLRHGALT